MLSSDWSSDVFSSDLPRVQSARRSGCPGCSGRCPSMTTEEKIALHPGAMTVGGAEGLALGEAGEGEGLQLGNLVVAGEDFRHQLADASHLEAVVGVRDHVGVRHDPVEHRHVVGREGADAAVAAILEVLA